MKTKVLKSGDLCRRCAKPVILRECVFKDSKLKKPYFFTHALVCTNCRAMYMSEEYKIYKQDYNKFLCKKQMTLL
jgi:hypothetical protein